MFNKPTLKSWTEFTTFHFLVTYEQAQEDRMFVTGKPFQRSLIQPYTLLGRLVSYEENGVL